MSTRLKTLLLTLCATVLLVAPSTASAGSYWWVADSSLMTPANGFQWTGDSRMNFWANRCEARSGTTYGVGTGCSLSWYVPANVDAQGGYWDGTHRSSSGQFRVVRTVEGNGTTVVQSANTAAGYRREWADMASYIRMTFEATASHSVSTGTAQFASMDSFAIVIVDPHSPGLNILSGHEGWKGPGGACIRYGYGEAGTGLQATALVNASTGAVYDNPSYASANITTGVFQNDRNCVSVGALPTGNYTFRASAVDKSGNATNNDFTVSFDTTVPAISAAKVGGTEVTNGRVLRGSAGQYRPTFTFDYSDAHSGMASVAMYLDGSLVSNSNSYTPPSNLSLGNHTITVVANDAVGNQASAVRTFSVVDDVLPDLTVAAPAADGSNSPTLDVTASDDHSGINPSTWNVKVNGVTLPVTLGSSRVQAAIGRLANGSHTIEIRVKDNAGNERVRSITQVASSDELTPPGLDGLFVMSSPQSVDQGDEHHVVVIAVKAGRPIGNGRLEITKVGGDGTVIAGKNVNPDGTGDLLVTFTTAGPMQIALPGSGLTPAQFTYSYRTPADPGYCTAHPTHSACQTPDPGPGGGSGTGGSGAGGNGDGNGGGNGTGGSGTGGTGGTGTGTGGTGESGSGGSGTSAGTSGGPNDKVAPKFTLKVVKTKPGVIRKTRKLVLRLTSNERATYTLTPVGSRVYKTAMRKQTKVLRIPVTGQLLKRIQKAKGKPVRIVVRVVAIDPNKNVRRVSLKFTIRP